MLEGRCCGRGEASSKEEKNQLLADEERVLEVDEQRVRLRNVEARLKTVAGDAWSENLIKREEPIT